MAKFSYLVLFKNVVNAREIKTIVRKIFMSHLY